MVPERPAFSLTGESRRHDQALRRGALAVGAIGLSKMEWRRLVGSRHRSRIDQISCYVLQERGTFSTVGVSRETDDCAGDDK